MKKDIWAELENSQYPAIAQLMSWATNYDFKDSPWALFLDVTDWSGENIGEKLVPFATLDYYSRPLFAAALTELDEKGSAAYDYIDKLEALMLETA